jgi:hypothetical protein
VLCLVHEQEESPPPMGDNAYYLSSYHRLYDSHPDLAEAICNDIAAIDTSDVIDVMSSHR